MVFGLRRWLPRVPPRCCDRPARRGHVPTLRVPEGAQALARRVCGLGSNQPVDGVAKGLGEKTKP